MDEMEYLVVNCVGNPNVVKALEEKTVEVPQWFLHSVVSSGILTTEHPLQPGKAIATMTFMVIFERPHKGPGNNGEIKVA